MRSLKHGWWRIRQPNPTPRDFANFGAVFALSAVGAVTQRMGLAVVCAVVAVITLAILLNDVSEFSRNKTYRHLRGILVHEFEKQLLAGTTALVTPYGKLQLVQSPRRLVVFHLSRADLREAGEAESTQVPLSCFVFDPRWSKVLRVTAVAELNLFDDRFEADLKAYSINTYTEEWRMAYEHGLLDASTDELHQLVAVTCESVPDDPGA